MPPAVLVPYHNPNPSFLFWESATTASPPHRHRHCGLLQLRLGTKTTPRRTFMSCSSPTSPQSLRCAVLGAGFAGLSVAWNLLQHSRNDFHMRVDVFDEVGVGGGASGVSGGLIHPYSPKVKPLWRGAECWEECLKLLKIAQAAIDSSEPRWRSREFIENSNGIIIQRRGILRPAVNLKNLTALNDNAQKCLASCRIESIGKDAAKILVPSLCLPFNSAFYMPDAVTIDPRLYLQGLFLACERLVRQQSTRNFCRKEVCLYKTSVTKLLEFADGYDAVIICLGAKANVISELSGRLPLRTCRGVIAHLQGPDIGEGYPDESPSILSDAWIAFQDSRSLRLGSTWEWMSTNHLPSVSSDEALCALQQLLPKASAIYPSLNRWSFIGASAGLRAMPPLTSNGSLPLMGCVDEFVCGNHSSKYWLLGGLGARGLLYHAWLGKLMAQAVLSCCEEVIPCELTSWKTRHQK